MTTFFYSGDKYNKFPIKTDSEIGCNNIKIMILTREDHMPYEEIRGSILHV